METIGSSRTVLTVLLFATLAALAAVLGTLPFHRSRPVPDIIVGFAYALASGLMLGAGYILLTAGLERKTLPVLAGAGLGVMYTFWTHRYSGVTEITAEPAERRGPGSVIDIVLLNSLHSASEGVAIGVAMVVGVKLGIFIAVSLAIHNIAESMVLTDVVRAGRTPPPRAAGLAIVTNLPQILLAVVAFGVAHTVPEFEVWGLGFAAGAMVYLVFTELLPHAYERTGRTRVALVVSSATGVIVLLRGFLA